MKRQLKGITWNHSRGYLPLVATAQVFMEQHPDTLISWTVRSLQAFADEPIEQLAKHYDLLIIDHPFAGRASRGDVLLPMDELLPAAFLEDQAHHSLGRSHESYQYGGHQWALAIDAATPVAGWSAGDFARGDSSLPGQKESRQIPESWDEVIQLARDGMVAFPALAIDSLMHFFMFCVALGEEPLVERNRLISREVGAEAYSQLLALAELCDAGNLDRNPIRTWQWIAEADRPIYCPFAYGYSNYSRRGYASRRISAGPPVAFRGSPLRTVLGGAGLAISTACADRELAADYAQFVAGPECQKTLYCAAGGQPGHRTAWVDLENNAFTKNYFLNTLPALDSAYVRPRFDGYLHLQDKLAPALHGLLKQPAPAHDAMRVLQQIVAG